MNPFPVQRPLIPADFGAQIIDTLNIVAHGLVVVVIAAAIAFSGWAVATLLSRAVRSLLPYLGVDAPVIRLAKERPVPEELLPSRLAGYGVFWCILVAATLLAFRVVGIDLVPSIASRLEDVIPRVLTSALVLVLGIPLALAASRILNAILLPTGIRPGRFRSQAVVAILVGFTVLLALEQLGLAAQLVLAVGITAVAAAGLALALAFGLGCRELARDMILEYLRGSGEGRGGERR
jgi:hypothetical protein